MEEGGISAKEDTQEAADAQEQGERARDGLDLVFRACGI
jgi:hypothetical protein